MTLVFFAGVCFLGIIHCSEDPTITQYNFSFKYNGQEKLVISKGFQFDGSLLNFSSTPAPANNYNLKEKSCTEHFSRLMDMIYNAIIPLEVSITLLTNETQELELLINPHKPNSSSHIKDQTKRFLEKTKQLHEKETALEKIIKDFQSLQEHIQAKLQEEDSLNEKIIWLQTELTSTKNTLEGRQEDALKKELLLKHQLETLNDQIAIFESEKYKQKKEAKITAKNQPYYKEDKQITEKTRIIKQLDETIERAKGDLKNLQEKFFKVQDQKNQSVLTKKHEANDSQRKQDRKKINDLERQLKTEIERKNLSLRKQKEEYDTEINGLETRIYTYEKDVTSLTQKLRIQETTISTLRAQLEAVQDKSKEYQNFNNDEKLINGNKTSEFQLKMAKQKKEDKLSTNPKFTKTQIFLTFLVMCWLIRYHKTLLSLGR